MTKDNMKKCTVFYMNGYDIIHEDGNVDSIVNILDMGIRDLLQSKAVYKDSMFKELYQEWSKETNIPLDNLMVLNYTERKNKTVRTNRRIEVDLNEEYKSNEQYTDHQIKNHLIPTKPEFKTIQSIYTRICSVFSTKRSFILLDDRKIQLLQGPNIENNSKTIFVALKYFDIFTQKLYFVDWIMLKTEGITVGNIVNYIETKLIPNTKSKRSYFQKLDTLSKHIDEFEDKSSKTATNDDIYDKRLLIYEEEAVSKNKGSTMKPLFRVNKLSYSDPITNDYYCGDIFIFQLNPFHPYFNTLESLKEMDNIKQMKHSKYGYKSLPLYFRKCQLDFEQKHVHWYPMTKRFIHSQLNVINIKIKVRDRSGWQSYWSKSLLSQKRLTKSVHEWQMEKTTTYGMIRQKLGSYYNINPKNIEIWLPQNTYLEKFDFGSKGRGKWNNTLQDLIDLKPQWQELCPLKFEIQPYNVKDFDEMTLYHDSSGDNIKFTERIKELAMFNFEIFTPNRGGPGSNRGMFFTVTYCKNWSAIDLIQHILKQCIENQVFGSSFSADIIEYVKQYETNHNNRDNEDDEKDLLILQNLEPNRFLIVDEDDKSLPTEYYMDKKYKMPAHFSQIKYTDFRLQFLAKSDPLVLKSNNDNIETKALWVYFRRSASYSHNNIGSTRIVIEEGQSLKDVIIDYIVPQLQVSEEEKKDNNDILFENITKTHCFQLKGYSDNDSLSKEILENNTIFDQLTDEMYLIIVVPKKAKKCGSTYSEKSIVSTKDFLSKQVILNGNGLAFDLRNRTQREVASEKVLSDWNVPQRFSINIDVIPSLQKNNRLIMSDIFKYEFIRTPKKLNISLLFITNKLKKCKNATTKLALLKSFNTKITFMLKYNGLICKYIFIESNQKKIWKSLLSAMLIALQSNMPNIVEQESLNTEWKACYWTLCHLIRFLNKTQFIFVINGGICKILKYCWMQYITIDKNKGHRVWRLFQCLLHKMFGELQQCALKIDGENSKQLMNKYFLEGLRKEFKTRYYLSYLYDVKQSVWNVDVTKLKTRCGWILCGTESKKKNKNVFSQRRKCKGCRLIKYCCRNHQKKHWNYIHNQQCLKLYS